MHGRVNTSQPSRCVAALALAIVVLALQPCVPAWAGLRVAVISDLNGAYGSTRYEPAVARAIERLLVLKPDLVISTGDMVAGQRLHPPLARGAVEAMWSAFHSAVTDPITAAGIPLAVTPGNHDASGYERFVMERSVFREQWAGRAAGLEFVDRADYPFHYAFALQDVLFVSIDATRVGPLDPGQVRWLDELLAREADRYRHRVVFGHLPIYPFAQGRETEVTSDHELERVLQRHGVELFLSGHHHAFYPGYHGGIRHVGQACLGAGPRRLIGSEQLSGHAITWLEFEGADLSVTGLGGPLFEQPVDLASLPASVSSRFGTLVRDDLRPARAQSAASARTAD